MAHWFLWQLAPLYSSCLPHSPSVTLFLAEKSKKEEKWGGFREGESWETLLAFAERRLIWVQPFLAFNHKWNPRCRGFLWDSSALMLRQVPYLPKPWNSVQARQPPRVHQAAGVWIWLWQQEWKEQEGFSILGEQDFSSPTTQHNEAMHVSIPMFFKLFGLKCYLLKKKKKKTVEPAHGLSVLHGARKS